MQPNKWEQKRPSAALWQSNLKNGNAAERRDSRNKHFFPPGWVTPKQWGHYVHLLHMRLGWEGGGRHTVPSGVAGFNCSTKIRQSSPPSPHRGIKPFFIHQSLTQNQTFLSSQVALQPFLQLIKQIRKAPGDKSCLKASTAQGGAGPHPANASILRMGTVSFKRSTLRTRPKETCQRAAKDMQCIFTPTSKISQA